MSCYMASLGGDDLSPIQALFFSIVFLRVNFTHIFQEKWV